MTIAGRLALVVTALVICTPAATAGPDAAPTFTYRYFDQSVPLAVDGTMIAAFVDPDRGPAAPALAAHGFGADEFIASSAPGWTYAVVPPGRALDRATELERDPAFDFVSPVFLGTGGLPVVVTRDVFVAVRGDVPAPEADALIAAGVPGTVLDRDFAGMAGVYRVRTTLRSAADVLEVVNGLVDADPRVRFAQSDCIYWAERSGGYVPNDPSFPQQWALDQANDHDLDGPEAWAVTTGDPSVVVGIIDSGIDQAHPDLSQVAGFDFTDNSVGGGPGGQCDNHGTAVAGCVSATIDNAVGVTGIAGGGRVRSVKVFNEIFFFFCLPFLESQDSWTANGITWTATEGIRVTNSSWGGGTASAVITNAFSTTRAQGVLHFAASGNGGTASISYPASLASVNAVGAINSSGARASFSQYGAGLFISAPGEQVLTTDRTGSAGYASGNWTTVDGTSFASPYAAGVAALVLAVDPALMPDDVETIMADSAKDRGAAGYDTLFGWGLASAGNAVAAAGGGGTCPEDVDDDGEVAFSDLLAVLAAWGPCVACPEDVDEDGEVGFSDLLAILAAWGGCHG